MSKVIDSVGNLFFSAKVIAFFLLTIGVILGLKSAKKQIGMVLLSIIFFSIIGKIIYRMVMDSVLSLNQYSMLLVLFTVLILLFFVIFKFLGKGISETVIGNFIYAFIRNIFLLPFRLLTLPFRLFRRR